MVIDKITKMIDLHLHLDGAVSLNSARELAALQGIDIPESDEELYKLMRVRPGCRSLNEFLDKFAFPCTLLQTPLGITTAMYNLCEELKAQNIIYAEVKFAPQKSCDRGMTQEEAVVAAIEGIRKSNANVNLILSCMRGEMTAENDARNRETIRLTRKYLGQCVCATDLSGAEFLYKTHTYKDLFAYARELGVPFEIHAGEADGPDSVRSAVSFGARRIGHGVRSVEDPSLLPELAQKQISLMICPTSNLQTGAVGALKDLPIRACLDAGVPFIISSDDPSVEGTDLVAEWRKVIDEFALSFEEVGRIMMHSVESAFCSETLREQLRREMSEAYLQ